MKRPIWSDEARATSIADVLRFGLAGIVWAMHFASLQLGEASLHVAAQGNDLQVRTDRQKLRLAPRRRGPDHGTFGKRLDRLSADQPILHVAARTDGGDGDLARADRFHILQRMDAEIDILLNQRPVQFLGPKLLAADLRQRTVLNAIARRLDYLNLHEVGRPAVRDLQCRGDLMCLRQCQRRATRA